MHNLKPFCTALGNPLYRGCKTNADTRQYAQDLVQNGTQQCNWKQNELLSTGCHCNCCREPDSPTKGFPLGLVASG